MEPVEERLPYISFVTAARNDNYGGDQRRRLQLSIGSLLEQLEKYRLESELILVDWNPPADRPPLSDLVKWPESLAYCTVRAITADPVYHRQFLHHEVRPLVTAAAVNIGIRRAKGAFILPRASDVFYSNELVSYLAEKKLSTKTRYRANRCNISNEILGSQYDTLTKQLDFCRNHIINEYTFRPQPDSPSLQLHTDASGDFTLMSRESWHQLRGFWERDVINAHADSLLCYASHVQGMHEEILKWPLVVYKIIHDQMFEKSTQQETTAGLPVSAIVRAIPSTRVVNTARSIYRKLNLRHFFRTRTKATRFGTPILSSSECGEIIEGILNGKHSSVFNNEHWGLGDIALPENVILKANWEVGGL